MPAEWEGYWFLAVLSSRIRLRDTSRLNHLAATVAVQEGVPPLVRIQAYRDLVALHCLAGEWFDAVLVIQRLQRICRRHHLQAPIPPELAQICRDQAGQQLRLSDPRSNGTALTPLPPAAELATHILQMREQVALPTLRYGHGLSDTGHPGNRFANALAAVTSVGQRGRRILGCVLGQLRHGEGVISYQRVSANCGLGTFMVATTVDKLVDAQVLRKRVAGRNGMHILLLNPHLSEALGVAEAEQPSGEVRPGASYVLGRNQPELRRISGSGRGADGSHTGPDGQSPGRDVADAAWSYAWRSLAGRNWRDADRRLHRCLLAQPEASRDAECHLLRGIAARNHDAPYETSTAHLLAAQALFLEVGDRQGEQATNLHLAAGALRHRRRDTAGPYASWLGGGLRETSDENWRVRSLCLQALLARVAGDGSADRVTRTALARRPRISDPGVQAFLSLVEGERALAGGWLDVTCRCVSRAQAWNSLAIRGRVTACEERNVVKFALYALDLEARRWLVDLRGRALQWVGGTA